MATFDFFDKRGTDEEQAKSNKKVHGGEATPPQSVGRRFPWFYRPRSFVRFSHNFVKSEMSQLWSSF